MATGYSKKKSGQDVIKELEEEFSSGGFKNIYLFYGNERYLLMHYLEKLRKVVPDGAKDFNYRRFDGKALTMRDLSESIDALPVFCNATLTEIWDFDFNKISEGVRVELLSILRDIPEYAHVVFVSGSGEFKLDGRIRANGEIKKLLNPVEFPVQGDDILLRWIPQQFKKYNKSISRQNSEYLSFITGGDMTLLLGEISKISAYSSEVKVGRRDIDAVVVPILDAQVYELTDAVLSGDCELAVKKLGELFTMNEAPHKILYAIGMRIRQLLYARVFYESGNGMRDFMSVCGIKYEFQAKNIFYAAKRLTSKDCAAMNDYVSNTAYKLNSSLQDDWQLVRELVIKLVVCSGVV